MNVLECPEVQLRDGQHGMAWKENEARREQQIANLQNLLHVRFRKAQTYLAALTENGGTLTLISLAFKITVVVESFWWNVLEWKQAVPYRGLQG